MIDKDTLILSIKNLKVLIVGDVMVDAYSWGDTNRLSPEAPVPVIEISKKEFRLGGAANVAKNVEALGAESIICSVIGEDEYSKTIIDLFKEENISTKGVYKSGDRKTTLKHRIFNDKKQVLRLDDEDRHDLDESDNKKVLSFVSSVIKNVDVVILQDYDKGVLNKNNIEKIIDIAQKHEKPVVVDPKENNFNLYKRVDLFKPNLRELTTGFNIELEHDDKEQIEKAVSKLKVDLEVDNVLLTLAEGGMYLDFKEGKCHIPTEVQSASDVSGAGDTVVSIAALLFALKTPPEMLGKIANYAAGMACKRVGVVSISMKELSAILD